VPDLKQAVQGPTGKPVASVDEQILQAFNTSLQLVVREMNILYSNIESLRKNQAGPAPKVQAAPSVEKK